MAACGDDSNAEQPAHDPPPEPPAPEPAVHRVVTTEEAIDADETYRLYRFRIDLSRAQLDLMDLGFNTTLSQALSDKDARLVVNGGYWDRDRRPEGLAMSRGQELFAYDPDLGGGIVVVHDGRARLLDGEQVPAAVPMDLAIQARPRLVVDSQRNIASDDGKRADRTALCIVNDGAALDVVVARGDGDEGKGGPTLYQFAERLVAHGCEGALNLDGGSSTGAAWVEDGQTRTLEPRSRLRVVLVVGEH